MHPESTWYEDEAALLGEIRLARREQHSLPTIPGYDELVEVGRGGQGAVYAAMQRSTHRKVAVKVLLNPAWESRQRRRRFEREVEVIASLRHPAIVQLFDSGRTQEGNPYYVMEYIDGCGLDALLGTDAGAADATVRQKLLRFAQIGEAIQVAHQRGVIHRDLKPSNILLDRDGQPHVVDFGLAKLLHDADHSLMSGAGQFIGTLAWASPEQVSGDPQRIDVRTDVYALGLILFQLLTGRFPYAVDGALSETLETIQHAEPVRPSALRGGLDDELDTIVLKCLAKDPDARYQSAAALTEDVRHYLAGEPITAKAESAWYVVRKKLRRYRLAATVGSLFLVVALVYATTLSVLYGRAVRAERQAAQALQRTQLAEEEARDEAVASRRSLDFLKSLLSETWTEHAAGEEPTISDALGWAAGRIETGWPDRPDIQAEMHNLLGFIYHARGDAERSVQQLQQARQRYRDVFGATDPRTILAEISISNALWDAGQLAESRTALEEARQAAEAALPAGHEVRLRAQVGLASLLREEGQLDEAEALARQALAEADARADGDDAIRLLALRALGQILIRHGKYAEATKRLEETLALQERSLGADHPDRLKTLFSLSLAARMSGDLEQAEARLRDLLAAQTRTLGATHPATLQTQKGLGVVLLDRDRPAEAEAVLRRVYESCCDVLGEEHPTTIETWCDLAGAVRAAGRPDEAAEMLASGLATYTRVLPEAQRWYVDYYRVAYAAALAEAGRLEQAEREAEAAYENLREALGADDQQVTRARERLEAIRAQRRTAAPASAPS